MTEKPPEVGELSATPHPKGLKALSFSPSRACRCVFRNDRQLISTVKIIAIWTVALCTSTFKTIAIVMDWSEVAVDGSLADLPAVGGPFFDRLAEVEPDEDARLRILVRRLGEGGVRPEHR